MTGRILRFDESRGYGFIAPDEGQEDVFMHANDLLAEEYLYQAGRRVEFFIEEGGKGPKASEIRLVTPAAASDPSPPARRYLEEVPPPSAPAPATPAASQDGQDDEPTCDVLSLADFRGEVTEILINADGTLTAAQIHRVRTRLAEAALAHGWVEASET
ncbi:cold shock domain-containing protein [Streptomyces sp. SBT349]|uniref:cold shock domain-containing protein n=1 Tax=Streptomyces sp. SBT349 TaxID=1580539 RepID=UPI00099DA9C8|nr:cold shock domain-containing protein [Streptomyces sp. SBT349]